MPTSDYHHITMVMHLIDQIAPKTILEVGIGFGKWGILCRELLDIGHQQNYKKETWTTRIEGIEIFPEYETPIWKFAYDRIINDDALKVLTNETRTFDLILCLDVIEHFPKEEGKKLLDLMLKRAKAVIVVSPVGFA